ncbi:MAG: sigma-70 family RNA polymerase sigma factor [Aestuariibacter sp.]
MSEKAASLKNKPQKSEDIALAFSGLQSSLRAFIKRRVSDEVVAEDILQDIFVKALSAQQSGRGIDNLSGWLFTTARNTIVDFYRSKRAHPEEVDEDIPAITESEQLALHTEFATCIEKFIDTLPAIYRETLRATEIERKTQVEVSRSHNVSLSAIKSRASRGRAMLKQKLLDCCEIEVSDGYVSDYVKKQK